MCKTRKQLKTSNLILSFSSESNQNSMNRLEDISQNVDFGPKRGKFEPKRAQNERNQIFPGIFIRLFYK